MSTLFGQERISIHVACARYRNRTCINGLDHQQQFTPLYLYQYKFVSIIFMYLNYTFSNFPPHEQPILFAPKFRGLDWWPTPATVSFAELLLMRG